MKKVVVAVLLGMALIGGAWAAQSGNIALSGTVGQNLAVVVAAGGSYNALDLSASKTDVAIGTASFTSNMAGSWVIKVYSANGSLLKFGTTDQQAYTFKLGALSSLQNITLGTAASKTTQSMSGKVTNQSYDATISYTIGTLTEGTYTDTIYIEIAVS